LSATKSNVPVVLVTSHRVTPGRLADFSVAARGMLSAALRSPGCLGGGLVGSESDDKRWQIECRFLDEESLISWERSDSYNRWGRYMQRFAAKIEIRRELGSTSLGQATEAAMAPVGEPLAQSFGPGKRARRGVVGVVSFVIVLGAVLAISQMDVPFLSGVSPLIRILVMAVVVTGVAIWAVPPMLTRMGESAESEPRIGVPRTRRSASAKAKAAKAEEKAREKEAFVGGKRRADVKANDTRETLEPVGAPVERNRRRKAEPELVAEPELIREPERVSERVSVPVGIPPEQKNRRSERTRRAEQPEERRAEPFGQPERVPERAADRVSVPVGPQVTGVPPRRSPGPSLPPPAPRLEPQGRPVVPLAKPRGGFFPTSPHRIPTTER